jgi:transposase
MEQNIYIGVDVAKHSLDVWIEGEKRGFQIKNTQLGVLDLIGRIERLSGGAVVVFEPTGGYERLLVRELTVTGIGHNMVHANKVRDYARASGVLAKTDKIDAKVIALYGRAFNVRADDRVIQPEVVSLRSLLLRRSQLQQQQVMEKNRLDKSLEAAMEKSIKKHIAWLDKEIAVIGKAIDEQVAGNRNLKHQVELLSSIPGVGSLTAATVIAELPELSSAEPEKLASLAGLAPYNRDSGKKSSQRFIKGGRANLRKALYMAALSASNCNPDLKTFYQRLKAKGKPAKLALIAIARKLIHILHSVSKRQSKWTVEKPKFIQNHA